MTTCSHNINEEVRFKLTQYGRDLVTHQGACTYHFDWDLSEGAWVKTQLWVFIRTFPAQMAMGTPPVIVDNMLYFGECDN